MPVFMILPVLMFLIRPVSLMVYFVKLSSVPHCIKLSVVTFVDLSQTRLDGFDVSYSPFRATWLYALVSALIVEPYPWPDGFRVLDADCPFTYTHVFTMPTTSITGVGVNSTFQSVSGIACL